MLSRQVSSTLPYNREERTRILALLEEISASQDFQAQQKSRDLLRYLVQEELDGRGQYVDGMSIARKVLKRGPDFDPTRSSVVRVQMFRLRQLLNAYNLEHPGQPQISIPSRSYRPKLEFEEQGDSGANTDTGVRLAERDDSAHTRGDVNAHSSAAAKAGAAGAMASAGQGAAHADHNGASPAHALHHPTAHTASAKGLANRHRHALLLFAALAVCAGLIAVLWNSGNRFGTQPPVANFVPSMLVRVSPTDPQADFLREVGVGLALQMDWTELPIDFRQSGEVEYYLDLQSEPYKPDQNRVTVSAYRKNGDLIGTKKFAVPVNPDSDDQFALSVKVFDNFADSHAIIPNDVRYSNIYPEQRRILYSCYLDAQDFQTGIMQKHISAKEVFYCLDPDMVIDPREKAILHVERASMMAYQLVGDAELGQHFTSDDVLAELEKADKIYKLPVRSFSMAATTEWKNPNRTDQSMRTAVERLEESSPDLFSKYVIAVSYNFFLDDFEKSRPYTDELVAAIENNQAPTRSTWYFAPIPELMINGDYDEAYRFLGYYEGAGHPTIKLFDLVLSCYRKEPERNLINKAQSLNDHLQESGMSLMEMIKRRRYSERLQANLVGAFATPQCSRFAHI